MMTKIQLHLKILSNRFVILSDNMPIGLSSDSGGYPFKTNEPSQVKYWLSSEDAEKYLDIITINRTSTTYISNYTIVEVEFRIRIV